jgi:hypothetical protein
MIKQRPRQNEERQIAETTYSRAQKKAVQKKKKKTP